MDAKPWYKSKTIWANAIALAAIIASRFGVEPIEYTGDQLALIMTVLNLILRFWTKKPVTPPLAGAAKEV